MDGFRNDGSGKRTPEPSLPNVPIIFDIVVQMQKSEVLVSLIVRQAL